MRRFLHIHDGWAIDLARIGVRRVLPNFLIIGAQKCGTTSLHRYLDQHPEIHMSRVKENNLFLDDSAELPEYHEVEPILNGSSNRVKRRFLSDDQILGQWLRDYRGEKILGDTSPYYTGAPQVGCEAPGNISRRCPDAKLLYLVRNPLDRIRSNFLHDFTVYARENRPLDGFDINRRVLTHRHYLDNSLYFMQLRRYLDLFGPLQIEVVILEELSAEPESVLKEICRFLEVDEGYEFDAGKRYNPTERRVNRWAPEGGRGLPGSLSFDRDLLEKLMEEIEPDVAELRKFLGRSGEIWSFDPRDWCGGSRPVSDPGAPSSA